MLRVCRSSKSFCYALVYEAFFIEVRRHMKFTVVEGLTLERLDLLLESPDKPSYSVCHSGLADRSTRELTRNLEIITIASGLVSQR